MTEYILETSPYRQFKHLKGVHFRNVGGINLKDSCFTIKDGDQTLYTSNIFRNSLNPSWLLDGDEKDVRQLYNIKNNVTPQEFVVRLLTDSGELLVEETLKFDELFLTHSTDEDVEQTKFPPKTVLFEFVDGMFVTEHKGVTMGIERKLLSSTFLQPSCSSIVNVPSAEFSRSLARTIGMTYSIQEARDAIAKGKKRVEDILKQQERMATLRQELSQKRKRIKMLQERLEEKKAAIQNVKENLQIKQQNQTVHETHFANSQLLLHDSQQQFSQIGKATIEHLRSQLNQTQRKINRRQRTIVKSLRDYVFVVETNQKAGHFVLNGLAISKGPDNLLFDDEAASALGYAVHCVRIISKLFQIPLRSPMFGMSSKSFVTNEHVSKDSQSQDRILPLFMTRNGDKSKYIMAVLLLRSNIVHILKSMGSFKKHLQFGRFSILEYLDYLLGVCSDL
ncbi:vacuolar protein sorting protein VPS38 [Acrasis kona]|uniref:Vacuolar protein sorting protein VPS38 n=1 Tax=Acrasis kona TaxID=1008807 RepID=A0AAW2ZSL1_9EUKA